MRGGRRPLPYGEVRVGPGEIAIGVESLPDVTATQREMYELAVAAVGGDQQVLVDRVTEAGIEVDAVDFDDASWPVRTRCVTADQLRRLLLGGSLLRGLVA